MNKANQKYKIGFNQIINAVNNTEFGNFDIVVGIGSGGIVPASLIAYKLGKDLKVLKINYRDEKNNPKYSKPKLLNDFQLTENIKNILLVDDVAVTGSTLRKAKEFLNGFNITTVVLKGKGDIVLFPELNTCVDWPWN